MKIDSSLKFVSFINYSTLLVLLSALILPVKAQIEPDTLTGTLDTIEVKAAHSAISSANSPFSLSLLTTTDRELTHSVPVTLDDMFNQMPGIWVNDRENYALGERITVRGIGWRAQFGVRGIQIVMDGIPLTMADGQAMLNVIDPIFIRRAELIRGPSSMFWGNSSGGVLYLSSVPPTNTQSPFLLRGTVGSYGLKKSDLQFTQRYGNHGVSGYASYMDQAGFRDHSEVQIGRAGLKGSIDLSPDSRISYFGAYASMPEAEHPSGLTKEQARQEPTEANNSFQQIGAGKEINQGQFGVNYSSNSSLGFLNATAYGTFRQLVNPLPFAIITLDRAAGGGRVTLQNDFSRFGFNLGIETKIQHDDRAEYENDNSNRGTVLVDQLEKVLNHGAFLTTTYSVGSLQFLSSIRYDWIRFDTDAETAEQSGNRHFQAFSPGVGINYSTGSIEFFGNLSTAFEAPTTTELVNRPGGGNGFNPNIEPEQTVGLEFGSRGELISSKLSYDLALYQLWISDLLFPYQLEANGPTYYRNQGETVHRGVEASLQYKIYRNIQAGLTYNLTEAQFERAETLDGESLEDKEIPGVPKHRLSGSLDWRPGDFWFTANVQFVSRFPVDNLNTAYNDAYTVLDTRISYSGLQLGSNVNLHPFIAVNNLFDTRYNGSVVVNAFGGRYYEPAAGINWRSGVSIQF